MAGSQFNEGWWTVLSNSVRTGVTATASFLIARLFRLAAARWNNPWSAGWGARGGALWSRRTRIWRLRIDLGFSLRTSTFGSERISLCVRYARDHPFNTQDKPSMANRATPVHRSIYWYRRSSAPNYLVA